MKTIRTLNGYCHITDTSIILSKKEGFKDAMLYPDNSSNMSQTARIFVGVIFAFMAINSEQFTEKLLYGLGSVILFISAFYLFSFSSSTNIEWIKIKKIIFIHPILIIRQPKIKIVYTSDNRNEKIKLIYLPSLFIRKEEIKWVEKYINEFKN